MPKAKTNIATVLKEEITRISRREVRSEILSLKKASSQYRSDIAALKRTVTEQAREIARLKRVPRAPAAIRDAEAPSKPIRFNAKGFASLRKRLGLSPRQMGLLVGVSDQSIHKWENDDVRPRQQNMPGIAAARTMGRREAVARLAELE